MRRDRSRRIRRLGALLIALPVAASFVGAQPLDANAAEQPRGCNRWHSLTQPPDTIRVLRTRSNNVQTVPFRRYVLIVMAKEWPSYLPQQVVEAGAVAVKQYAWYHALYTTRSSRGGCFDVKDGTGDQIFRPRNNQPNYDHYRALDATWNVSLRKRGSFFMTAYRRGAKARCGRDSNGNRLYAISAKHCAERHGYSWRQILREYYGNVSFVEGGGGSGVRADASAPTPGSAEQSAPQGTTTSPTEPTAPSQPTAPTAPAEATAPTAPTEPTEPTAPSTPATVDTPTTNRPAANAQIFPGVLPEDVGHDAPAPPAPITGDAPSGNPPAPGVGTAVGESAPQQPTNPAAITTGAAPTSWTALTVALLAALASVAVILKRRRGYLR